MSSSSSRIHRRRSFWRPTTIVLFVLVLALGLAAADRLRSQRAAVTTEPGRGASWIWADGVADSGEPMAFYAVRDVVIEAAPKAWISIVADEMYTLWVNGRRIGSGGFRPGSPADFYDVSDELRPGTNRLMIEASSTRGAGGLMASLRLGAPDRPFLGTDESWRIFRYFDLSVFAGTRLLGDSGGDKPVVWQQQPTGRWRPAEALALRPGPPRQWRAPKTFSPVRARHSALGSEWQPVDPAQPLRRYGGQAVFDLGRDVLGHLEAGFDISPGPALLYFDADDPGELRRPPDAILLPVNGSREWRDPFARRFRYVTIVATRACNWMQVTTVSPERAARHRPPPSSPRGVFGLPAPSPYRRVEELVWQRLREQIAAAEEAKKES